MVLLARRFLNLIVPGRSPGVKFLRRIDLTPTGNPLFYRDASENPAAAGASPSPSPSMSMAAMETIRFADPSFTFRALNKEWKLHCFPIIADYSECNLICADQSGRGFVFDLDSSKVSTLPALRKPWLMHPVSVFVHKSHVDGNPGNESNGSSLFVMEKFPQPEARRGGAGGGAVVHGRVQEEEESAQFVGFIKHCPNVRITRKSWHCRLLPPPPFVLETGAYSSGSPEITAYGVVGGGTHVCVSVDGVGTYCLDTESLAWSQVGEWTLPFRGKVEYVPELKLWFGLSGDDAGRHRLAAADLSGMPLDSSSSSSYPHSG